MAKIQSLKLGSGSKAKIKEQKKIAEDKKKKKAQQEAKKNSAKAKELNNRVNSTKKVLGVREAQLKKQVATQRKDVASRGITPGNNTFSAPNMFTQRNKTLSDSRTGKAPVLNRNNNAQTVANREKSEAANVKKYQSYATSNEGQKQIAKTQEAKDYRNIARSQYDVAQANYDYETSSGLNRTIKNISAPVRGFASGFFKSDNTISGKTANKVYGTDVNAPFVSLPNYNDATQDIVSKNSKGFGKIYNDFGYGVGKIGSAAVLNAVAPGLGTTSYTLNAGLDTYNQNISNGYSHGGSAKNALVDAGMELVTGKLLGASAGMFNKTGELEKVLQKTFSPLIKNPKMNKFISGASGEFAEEFVQNVVSPIVNNLTLNTNEKITWDTILQSAYAGFIGFLTGGSVTGMQMALQTQSAKKTSQIIKEVESDGKTKLSDKQINGIFKELVTNEYLSEVGETKPYTEKEIQNVVQKNINDSANNATAQEPTEQNIQSVPTNQDSARTNIEQTSQNEQNVRQEIEPQKSVLSEAEANELKTLEDLPFDLEETQEKRLNYLKAKQEGRIKYADLKTNNEYEDIKKDYNKYRNTEDFDASTLNAAKDFVPGYKNTERRTKQEWLEVARLMGSNLDVKNSEELTKYALQSWHATKPNQKDNLNRQGKKFVDFKVSDWVNEVYKGAGVGQETQASPIQTNVENADAIEYNKTGVDINERNQTADENSRNEFRRLQEESRRLSKDQHELLYRGDKSGIKRVRENISRVLQPKLESIFSSNNDSGKSVRNGFTEVKNTDFQEIFELNHPYLRNPDTVSVYGAEDYKNNKNYLSEDGLSGFSITPSGDLISVFNNSGKPGMLQRISDIVRAEAKTLDCFSSKAQDLPSLYQDAFGLKVASIMDFNYDIMAEEHGKEYADAFVEKYGEAPVYFMVKSDKNVTPKHFNKNQYDEAANYRDSFIEDEGTSDSSFSNEKTKANSDMSNNASNVSPGDTTATKALANQNVRQRKPQAPEKERKMYQSMIESEKLSSDTKKIAKNKRQRDTFTPLSNAKTLSEADVRIQNSSPQVELNRLMSSVQNGELLNVKDVAVAERLLEFYDKHGTQEQIEDIVTLMALNGTNTARSLQIMAQIKKDNPQFAIKYLEKAVQKANSDLERKRYKENQRFTITEEMREKLQNATKENIDETLEQIYEDLGSQVAQNRIDQIDSWRYFSMLANPTTHIRNIMGNKIMRKVKGAKDLIAGTIEEFAIKEGERTRRGIGEKVTKQVKEFAEKDINNREVQSMLGLNQDKYNPKSRIESNMKTFNSEMLEKTLGKAFKFNTNMLEYEDKIAMSKAYKKSLASYMTANKIDPSKITSEQLSRARSLAVAEAKEATFRQECFLGNTIKTIEERNLASKVIVGGMLPFKNTPINIAKTGLEYNPINLAKAVTYDVSRLKKGQISANDYINNLSKGLTGTGIALVGFYLAQIGLLNVNDDDKEGKYLTDQGYQSYSINFDDDTTISLDWLAPSVIPLFIGAQLYKSSKAENQDVDEMDAQGFKKIMNSATNLANGITNSLNPMTDMTMLSGLTSALKSYQSNGADFLTQIATNTVTSYVNQMVPTAASKVARIVDPVKRSTSSTESNMFAKAIDSTKNQIINKLPVASKLLPAKTDVWGNEITQSESVFSRIFNNLLNPANINNIKGQDVSDELEAVYAITGDARIMPSTSIPKTLQTNNKKYRMSGEEYARYKATYGKTAYEAIQGLLTNPEYNASDELDKAKIIKNIYDYATIKAKKEYYDNKGITDYKIDGIEEVELFNKLNFNGYEIGEYATTKQALSDIKGDSKLEGEDKRRVVASTLIATTIQDEALYMLYNKGGGYGSKESSDALINAGISAHEYLKYQSQDLSGTKDSSGKTIRNSRKAKVISAVNQLNLTPMQKAILIKKENLAYYAYDSSIINFVNEQDLTTEEKLELLDNMGFVIRNGKVYKR